MTKPIFTEHDKEICIARAVELFKSGYNCSQSVVAAYSEYYGLTKEQALLVSASFGGGIGRMRKTCGAACGMFILAGLECGSTEANNSQQKNYNYATVQKLAQKFKDENGSITCAELLGLVDDGKSTVTGKHTDKYNKKHSCVKMVESGAKIFADFLLLQQ